MDVGLTQGKKMSVNGSDYMCGCTLTISHTPAPPLLLSSPLTTESSLPGCDQREVNFPSLLRHFATRMAPFTHKMSQRNSHISHGLHRHHTKHLIAISTLAIKCLSRTCRRISPQCTIKTLQPTTSTQITPLTPANTQPQHPLVSIHEILGCTLLQHPPHKRCSPPTHLTKGCLSCAGTAQVGVLLIAPLDSDFNQSSLRIFFTVRLT